MPRLTFIGGPQDGEAHDVIPRGVVQCFHFDGKVTHQYAPDWDAGTAEYVGVVVKGKKTIGSDKPPCKKAKKAKRKRAR